MQPTLTKDITTTGHLPGKFTPLGIDQEDMPHIMGMLTRQYSDAVMAVLREYSANARDEHTALGISRPIEVTLPNRFNTFLTIKDYGRGMSVDFVENRYSKYGKSTKRGEVGKGIGGFGIGGKAALAYTDSFNLTSVKDGRKGVYVISRDASGAAGLTTLVNGEPTNEPNYTEVKVPCVNVEDFESKAEFLFKFWPEGSVIVNGEAPRRHDGMEITDNIWYSRGSGQSYLVMGGIPYRVAHVSNYLPSWLTGFNFIAEVGIDAADITPSREDLEYSTKTVAVLNKVGQEFADAFIAKVQDEIDLAPTAHEAYDLVRSWQGQFTAKIDHEFTYKGEAIPDQVDVTLTRWNVGMRQRSYYYSSYSSQPIEKVTSLSVADARRALIITGKADVNAYTKSRVSMYLSATNQPRRTAIYFTDKPLDENKWVGKWDQHLWTDVLAETKVSKPRSEQTFEVIVGHYTTTMTLAELKASENIVYISAQKAKQYNYTTLNVVKDYVEKLGFDMTLVKIPEKRQPKFAQKFGAVSLNEFLTTVVVEASKSIKDEEWKRKSLNGTAISLVKMLAKQKIDDPRFAEALSLVKSVSTDHLNMVHYLSRFTNQKLKDKEIGYNFTDDYPLLDNIYLYEAKASELALYINAKYASRKDNK